MWKINIIILIICNVSNQKSLPGDDSYVAAVVEYEVQDDNLQNYLQLIEEASEKNADIIVFPEMTLTKGLESIPVPIHGSLKEHPVPALMPSLFDEVLVALSNASRQHQIYVLVNVQEIMDCSDAVGEYCPAKRTYLFNTNVVFDRNGAVIDRYRKINLYEEFTRSAALQPDLGFFTTDFGVTFGHFICFDILFQVPAVQVVQKYNLTDVIFPTMWFSQLPYLTATEIQEAYAYAMNINFLAAGANQVSVGSAGSGIYSGKAGALISVMPGAPTTRLLIARVPKVPGQVSTTYPGHTPNSPFAKDELFFKKDHRLRNHVSLPLLPGYQEVTLTDRNVTCIFKVELNQTSDAVTPRYRAFIQDSNNKYSTRWAHIAACTLVACEGEDLESCPYRFPRSGNNVEITQLSIEMSTYASDYSPSLACSDVIYYPLSFTVNNFPLNVKNYSYSETLDQNTANSRISYRINNPQSGLISFGIWGRVYSKDIDTSRTNFEVVNWRSNKVLFR